LRNEQAQNGKFNTEELETYKKQVEEDNKERYKQLKAKYQVDDNKTMTK
jgi:hypothetical protein